MIDRQVVFSARAPEDYSTAVHLTARRESGPPPGHGFNVWAHVWMALEFEPGAVYPNWTVAENDVHLLAEGFRRISPRLPLEDVAESPFGVVVTSLGYSNADYVEGAVSASMAYWLADEFGVDRPEFLWEWDDESQRNVLRLDC